MPAPKYEIIDNMSEYTTAVETLFNLMSSPEGHLTIGVSGGSAVEVTAASMERLYKGGAVKKVDIFFCDERIVPYDDPESIYGAYFKKIKQMSEEFCQFHRVNVSYGDVGEIAKDYEKKIRKFFGMSTGIPRFDCLLLGMGDDGHTCSLFPGNLALKETEKLITDVTDATKAPPVRVTMTFPILNAARSIAFLVRGTSKAQAVKAVLKDSNAANMPAGQVRPTDPAAPVMWFLDSAAGSLLK